MMLLLPQMIVLFANTLEETRYMVKLANVGNAYIQKNKNLPKNSTSMSNIEIKENFTLNISYKTNFSNLKYINSFKNMNKILMKRKFCAGTFYEKMKKGFIVVFMYYSKNNKLITSFELKKDNCKEANAAMLNSPVIIFKKNNQR